MNRNLILLSLMILALLAFAVLATLALAQGAQRQAEAAGEASSPPAPGLLLQPATDDGSPLAGQRGDEGRLLPDSLGAPAPAPAEPDSSREHAGDEPERGFIQSLRFKLRVARAVLDALLNLVDQELGRLALTAPLD